MIVSITKEADIARCDAASADLRFGVEAAAYNIEVC